MSCGLDSVRSPPRPTVRASGWPRTWRLSSPTPRPAQSPSRHCKVHECRFSDQPSTFTVALVGDSHANLLVTPLLIAAKARGWRVLLIWSGDCRAALPLAPSPRKNENGDGCSRWKENVTEGLAKRSDIDVVVTTGWTKEYPGGGSSQLMAQLAKGFSATWDRWAQGGRKVLAIRDVPFHPAQAVPDCISLSVNSVDPCSLSRPEADPTDPVDLALTADHTPNVHSLDLSSNFCDRTTCHFVVGGSSPPRPSPHDHDFCEHPQPPDREGHRQVRRLIVISRLAETGLRSRSVATHQLRSSNRAARHRPLRLEEAKHLDVESARELGLRDCPEHIAPGLSVGQDPVRQNDLHMRPDLD